MNTSLIRELELVRDACKEVEFAQSSEEVAKIVSQIQEYVSKIIVNESELKSIGKNTLAELANIAPETSGDLATINNVLTERIYNADITSDNDAKSLAGKLVATNYKHWRNYAFAIEKELQNIGGGDDQKSLGDPAEIDRQALGDYIATVIPSEDNIKITDVRAASIGNSKATLLLTLSGNKVLPDEVVVRKDQEFNFLGTHVKDEFPALKILYDQGVPVPQPYVLESTGKVLGQPFLLCSKISGSPLGTIYFPPPRNDKTLASVARALAKIHSIPVDDLNHIGVKGPQRRGFVIAEIEKYAADWKALNIGDPLIDTAFIWVKTHLENAYGKFSIVHNDYSYHNILIDNDEVSAVLDWEFVHIGNPVADLSYFMDDAEKGAGFDFFLNEYVAAGGEIPSQKELDFYYIWGHTRFAVMCMQNKVGLERGDLNGLRPMMPTLHYLPKPMLALGKKLEEVLAN